MSSFIPVICKVFKKKNIFILKGETWNSSPPTPIPFKRWKYIVKITKPGLNFALCLCYKDNFAGFCFVFMSMWVVMTCIPILHTKWCSFLAFHLWMLLISPQNDFAIFWYVMFPFFSPRPSPPVLCLFHMVSLLLRSKVVGGDVARATLRTWLYKNNYVHSVGGNCFY